MSCDKDGGDNLPALPLRDGLYINASLSTGPISNNRYAAPAGTTWSEAQEQNNISNTHLGYPCSYDGSNAGRVADDFTIPPGQSWSISKVCVYALANHNLTDIFDGMHVRIWDGNPSLPNSNILYGDLTTNVYSHYIDSFIYAIPNSNLIIWQVPSAHNKIWKITGNVSKTLPAGTYWLEWEIHGQYGSLATPPAKVKGVRGLPHWNAIYYYEPHRTWYPAADDGNPFTNPTQKQDVAFEILYKY